MQMERYDRKCMIGCGVKHRQSPIHLMCSVVPAMTSSERREKEKELQRVREDIMKEKEELREIQQELQQIRENVNMQEQGMKRLQKEYDNLNRDYQYLHLQNQRELSRYQSILASRANHQIDDSSLPTTEELRHADTIVSYGV